MATSAQSLSELFASISAERNPRARFLSVAADKLGIDGPDREAQALLIISRLIRQVRLDLESISLLEQERELLNQHLNKFSGLVDFSHAHLDMENSKRNSITTENITGLIYIQMALKGLKTVPVLDEETLALSETFRSFRTDVAEMNLPESLKEAVITRLTQIANALDQFQYFGQADIQREISALVGDILLNASILGENEKSVFKKVLDNLGKATSGVKRACEVALAAKEATDLGIEAYGQVIRLLG